MGPSRAIGGARWRNGAALSCLPSDVAAGHPIDLHRSLDDDEVELAALPSMARLMADSDNRIVSDSAIPPYHRLASRRGVGAVIYDASSSNCSVQELERSS